MATAKITRFALPQAKLLQFNRQGKSIPGAVQKRDELAERFWALRHTCDEAGWAAVRPYLAEYVEMVGSR